MSNKSLIDMESEELQTLVFVIRDGRMLLGFKLRGFGAGKWNGFGGKLEGDEEPVTCARRELLEESQLLADVDHLNHLGYVKFCQAERRVRKVHIYTCNRVQGDECETEEMKPKWFELHELPYDQMWEDSFYWMPFVIREKKIKATIRLTSCGRVEALSIASPFC